MMKQIEKDLRNKGQVEERKLVVVEQLFSRVVLCHDLESAFETSKDMRSDGVTFVTLEGDVVIIRTQFIHFIIFILVFLVGAQWRPSFWWIFLT